MSHSFTHLLYHVVFATKHRVACLDDELSEKLYPVLANLIRDEGGVPVAVNGMPDHVHLLARLRQSRAVSDVVRAVKAGSSRWVHQTYPALADMAWQTGYGAFTVSASQRAVVGRYVERQKENHARRTYLAEIRELLAAHELAYTEEDLAEM